MAFLLAFACSVTSCSFFVHLAAGIEENLRCQITYCSGLPWPQFSKSLLQSVSYPASLTKLLKYCSKYSISFSRSVRETRFLSLHQMENLESAHSRQFTNQMLILQSYFPCNCFLFEFCSLSDISCGVCSLPDNKSNSAASLKYNKNKAPQCLVLVEPQPWKRNVVFRW